MQQPLCHGSESSALLQFKQSFLIDEHCDRETGHVIGLHLASSCLSGSINSSSTLFSFSGELSASIGRLGSLIELDISACNFTRLQSLQLDCNMLQGPLPIPPPSTFEYSVSGNKLAGEISPLICYLIYAIDKGLPHNLGFSSKEVFGNVANCFPSALPQLQVLILRSNRFHGAIGSWHSNFRFPKLRIVDLSDNKFIGDFPSEYFQNWDAMKGVTMI
ncbi:hypothetical protein AAG906_031198 [Vitis piasezkii]